MTPGRTAGHGPFAITETPLAAPAWADPGNADHLAALSRDIGRLLYEAAQARLERSEEERRHQEHVRRMLLSILEAMDAFERVFRNAAAKQDLVDRQTKKWLSNFRTVLRMLGQLVEAEGAVRIENLDGGFDPHWHRVAEVVEDSSRPVGTIVEEVKRGYVWNGAVLRKAEVVVVGDRDSVPKREDAGPEQDT